MKYQQRNIPFQREVRRNILEVRRKMKDHPELDHLVERLNEYDSEGGRTRYKVNHVKRLNGDDMSLTGWPEPVIATVSVRENKGSIGYWIYDNSDEWLSDQRIGYRLTRKSAEKFAYNRANKIADIVSRRTGAPIAHREVRY